MMPRLLKSRDQSLMLDTSRIVARGYAIVKKEESVVDSAEFEEKRPRRFLREMVK